MDHLALDHFAVIMFADLKSYIFRSKFLLVRPEYPPLTSLLALDKTVARLRDLAPDSLYLDPDYDFGEVGSHANYGSLFAVGDKLLSHEFVPGQDSARFGFFDGNGKQAELNSLLLNHLEFLKAAGTKQATILLFKDFLAKRAPFLQTSQNNVFVQVQVAGLEFAEQTDFSKLEETSFNLKELMDEKE